jgi:hypothetical protein
VTDNVSVLSPVAEARKEHGKKVEPKVRKTVVIRVQKQEPARRFEYLSLQLAVSTAEAN